MKIVVCSETEKGYNKIAIPSFYTKVDSTLLKGGKPFFVPDFTSQCVITIHLVARICRLGKCFSTRFAHRYVDAWTFGANFVATDLMEGPFHSRAVDFDGSTMIGSFIDTGSWNFESDYCSIKIGEKDSGQKSLNNLDTIMYSDIAQLGNFFTWRHGDLLFSRPLIEATPVIKNTHVSCEYRNQLLLDFNIK